MGDDLARQQGGQRLEIERKHAPQKIGAEPQKEAGARASMVFGHGAAGRSGRGPEQPDPSRSEEHTSELQSLMRISYAVFCLKKKNINKTINNISKTRK